MTPRYQNSFVNSMSNSIFVGRHGAFDLYCYTNASYFPFIAVRNNHVYWEYTNSNVQEAMKRAQQLLGHNLRLID